MGSNQNLPNQHSPIVYEVLAVKFSVQEVQIVRTRGMTVPRVPLYESMFRYLCVRVDLVVELYGLGFSTLFGN